MKKSLTICLVFLAGLTSCFAQYDTNNLSSMLADTNNIVAWPYNPLFNGLNVTNFSGGSNKVSILQGGNSIAFTNTAIHTAFSFGTNAHFRMTDQYGTVYRTGTNGVFSIEPTNGNNFTVSNGAVIVGTLPANYVTFPTLETATNYTQSNSYAFTITTSNNLAANALSWISSTNTVNWNQTVTLTTTTSNGLAALITAASGTPSNGALPLISGTNASVITVAGTNVVSGLVGPNDLVNAIATATAAANAYTLAQIAGLLGPTNGITAGTWTNLFLTETNYIQSIANNAYGASVSYTISYVASQIGTNPYVLVNSGKSSGLSNTNNFTLISNTGNTYMAAEANSLTNIAGNTNASQLHVYSGARFDGNVDATSFSVNGVLLAGSINPTTNGSPSSVDPLVTNYLGGCSSITATNSTVNKFEVGYFYYQNANWYSFNSIQSVPSSYLSVSQGTISPAYHSVSGYYPSYFPASELSYTIRPGQLQYSFYSFLGTITPAIYTVYATVTNISYTYSGVSSSASTALSDLLANLRALGLMTNAYAIYPFCGQTASCDAKNLLNTGYNITWHNAITNDSSHGSWGITNADGQSYGDTGININSIGVTNLSIVFAATTLTTSTGGSGTLCVIGAQGSPSNPTYIISGGLSGSLNGYVEGVLNDVFPGGFNPSTSDVRWPIDNTGGIVGYALKDGTGSVALTTYAVTNASSASYTASSAGLPNANLYIGAQNNNGTVNSYMGNFAIEFVWVGNGLTLSQLNALELVIEQYNTELGRPAF